MPSPNAYLLDMNRGASWHNGYNADATAERDLERARAAADSKAAALLAARECPESLRSWGRIHGIPEFARLTWEAGFLAGMQIAELASDENAHGVPLVGIDGRTVFGRFNE